MKDYFINLFNYEGWANNEINNCLAGISEPPQKALSIMSHLFNAQTIWFRRMKGLSSDVGVWDIYDKDNLIKVGEESCRLLEEFIKGISDKDLENIISYTNTKGENFTSRLEDILTHLALHSAYHRGQIIVLIKPLAAKIPYTDYIHFVRNIKTSE